MKVGIFVTPVSQMREHRLGVAEVVFPKPQSWSAGPELVGLCPAVPAELHIGPAGLLPPLEPPCVGRLFSVYSCVPLPARQQHVSEHFNLRTWLQLIVPLPAC